MHWTQLERALLAKVTRYPLSMTPRERWTKLAMIRSLLMGVAFALLGFAIAFAGYWADSPVLSPTLVAAGGILFLLGVGLLMLANILAVVVRFIFGDE